MARRPSRADSEELTWVTPVFEPEAAEKDVVCDDVFEAPRSSPRRIVPSVPFAIAALVVLAGFSFAHLRSQHPVASADSSAVVHPTAVAGPALAAAPPPPAGCPESTSCTVLPLADAGLRDTVARLFEDGEVVWAATTVDVHSGRPYEVEVQIAAAGGVRVAVVSQRTAAPSSTSSAAWKVVALSGKEPLRPHYAAQQITTVRGHATVTIRVSAHRWILPPLPVAAAEQFAASSSFQLE